MIYSFNIYSKQFKVKQTNNNFLMIQLKSKSKTQTAIYNTKKKILQGDILDITPRIKKILFKRLRELKRQNKKDKIYTRDNNEVKRNVSLQNVGKQTLKQKVKATSGLIDLSMLNA